MFSSLIKNLYSFIIPLIKKNHNLVYWNDTFDLLFMKAIQWEQTPPIWCLERVKKQVLLILRTYQEWEALGWNRGSVWNAATSRKVSDLVMWMQVHSKSDQGDFHFSQTSPSVSHLNDFCLTYLSSGSNFPQHVFFRLSLNGVTFL